MRTSRVNKQGIISRTSKAITAALAFALPLASSIHKANAQSNEPEFVDPGPLWVGGNLGVPYFFTINGEYHTILVNIPSVGSYREGRSNYLYPSPSLVKMDRDSDGVLTPEELRSGTGGKCDYCEREAAKLLEEHPAGVKALPLYEALKVIAQLRELRDIYGNIIRFPGIQYPQPESYQETPDMSNGPSTSLSPYQAADMNPLAFAGLSYAQDNFSRSIGEYYSHDIDSSVISGAARVRVYAPFFILAEYTNAKYGIAYYPIPSQLVMVDLLRRNIELGAGIANPTSFGTFYAHATTGPSWHTNSTNFYINRFALGNLSGTSHPLLLDASFAAGYDGRDYGVSAYAEGSTNTLRPLKLFGRYAIPWSFIESIPTILALDARYYRKLPVQGSPDQAYSLSGESQAVYVDVVSPVPWLQWRSNSFGLYLNVRTGFTNFSTFDDNQQQLVGAAGFRFVSGLANMGVVYDFVSGTGMLTASFSGSGDLSGEYLPIAIGASGDATGIPLMDNSQSLTIRGAYLRE